MHENVSPAICKIYGNPPPRTNLLLRCGFGLEDSKVCIEGWLCLCLCLWGGGYGHGLLEASKWIAAGSSSVGGGLE